jgi:hypothetical protein
MTDRILSILALAGFSAFLFILAWWVRELDLTIVIIVGVAMAAYDFWRLAFRSDNNGRDATRR